MKRDVYGRVVDRAASAGARSRAGSYSTREVARIVGCTASQVRSYVRAGFLSPARDQRRAYRFTFQDIVILRAAHSLVTARIPRGRIRSALERLQGQLPRGRSLSGLRIYADGGHIVAQDGTETWDAESGQQVIDFEVAELADKVAPLVREAKREVGEGEPNLEADDWFDLALEWEATALDEAKSAYSHAIDLDERHPDAHLNLGRLLHEEGDLDAAERHYRRAIELRPTDVTAWFNLGVLLQDEKRWRDAAEAYKSVVRLDPAYLDAYFNLAALYEALGNKALAIQHLKTYKRLAKGE